MDTSRLRIVVSDLSRVGASLTGRRREPVRLAGGLAGEAAVAERELANNSKTDGLSATASSCIGTLIEVQSLQLLSFLYCICHVVVVVQDSLADPVIIR